MECVVSSDLLPDGVPWTHCKVVSQARPSSAREGKGLVNCVYKLYPAALYSVVQSTLQYFVTWRILSSSSHLVNSEHERHLFHYCTSSKNTSIILLREHAYFATGNSRVHYLKSGYVIQLIAFWWKRLVYAVTRPFPSSAEVGWACETNCTVTLWKCHAGNGRSEAKLSHSL